MSEKKHLEGEQGFGEADVAEILERAIKLDGARDTRVTVEQLREAALEVGVSPAAFTQAMAEFAQDHTPPEDAPPTDVPVSRFRSVIRTGLAVAFGGALGATAGIMDGPYLHGETAALAAILLAGGSLHLVLSHRKEKGLLPYIVNVIWLWSSFVVALGLVTEYLSGDYITGAVMGILVSSAVGALIIKLTGKNKAPEAPPTLRLELTAPREETKG